LFIQNNKEKDNSKPVYYAIVEKIGPEVEKITFKVGDRVMYNDYDCKIFGDEVNTYGLTKAESVWAVYTEE
jgi:co-chaperonin GroES (HSP10)